MSRNVAIALCRECVVVAACRKRFSAIAQSMRAHPEVEIDRLGIGSPIA